MRRVATGINSVVEMKNLTVGYGIKEVLTGIQANISRGQFVSLLGPNGVGKTTLLRTLSRHLQKIEGNIFINDRPIESYGQRDLACNLAVVLTSRINDIDYHVAKAIGARVISERPFRLISDHKFRQSIAFLEKVDQVIDSGFPVRPLNKRNLRLVIKALDKGKDVYTLRSREEARHFYGALSENLIYCEGLRSILERIVNRET